jgi:molybdate transport system ATP-binding protein
VLEFLQADFGFSLPAFGRTLDWTIRTGEQWAICGPTGSGKSMIINGILKKTPLVSGRILYYFDQNIGEGRSFFHKNDVVRVSTRDLGHQHNTLPGFYQSRWHSMQETDTPTVSDYLKHESLDRISPFEVLDSPASPSHDNPEMGRIIDLTGIRHLMNRRVHHLSHGELRKTLIARALIQRPKLLILEEPFAGLDTGSRKRFRNIMEFLINSRDFHILVVTARPEDIPDGVTHVLDMENGRAAPLNRTSRRAVSAPIRPCPGPGSAPDTCARIDAPLIIDMKNTTVNYGGVPILDRIDWQVRQGER